MTSDALTDYRATQDRIRDLHRELSELAVEIGREAESLRRMADDVAAIAEKRTVRSEAVIAAAREQARVVPFPLLAEVAEKIEALTVAQTHAAEIYPLLSPEEQVGQIPAPVLPAEG